MRNSHQPVRSEGSIAGVIQPNRGVRTRIFLLPGELHATKDATEIATILGSCVAVCLWDCTLRVGGMNHFLLPEREGENISSRFGNVAIKTLLEMMYVFGCRKHDIVAKVFGGASLFRKQGSAFESLGDKNAEAAIRMMEREKIQVAANQTGGDRGRKLIFHTDTGDAWTRYV